MDSREDEVGTVPIGRLDGRADRRRAAVVVGAIGLLVVIGLASAQLKPEVTPPVAIVPVQTDAPTTDAPPSPSRSIEVTPPRLRAAELVEAVLSGSLEHKMVFADATLDVACGDAHQPCDDAKLTIEGLALDVLPGTLGTKVGIPLPRSVLVLEVQGSVLVYRGALIVYSNGTPRYEVLAGGSAAGPPDPSALTDVAGWLVLDGPCLGPSSGSRPCARRATLANEEPTSAEGRPIEDGPTVAVPVGAWGIDDSAQAIVPGPFLARQNPATGDDEPDWQIVARYDPSRSVRVVIP
jgi:hypothetical protein